MSVRRKRSGVWQHFQQVPIDADDESKGVKMKCTHCARELSVHAGSTANMIRHLRRVHPEIECLLMKSTVTNPLELDGSETEYITEDGQKLTPNEVFLMQRATSDDDASSDDDRKPTLNLTPRRKAKINRNFHPIPLKRKSRLISEQDTTGSHTKKSTEEDRFDIFARLVALKMRNLQDQQRIVAEKIINDTLHEAELNNLNRYCGLNMMEIQVVDQKIVIESEDKSVTTNS